MGFERCFRVTCNGCGHQIIVPTSDSRQARISVQNAGWLLKNAKAAGGEIDLHSFCPTCRKNIEE